MSSFLVSEELQKTLRVGVCIRVTNEVSISKIIG